MTRTAPDRIGASPVPAMTQLEPLIATDPAVCRAAALTVCQAATNLDDARRLLAALGLDQEARA
ncbi:hypothetical protein [Cellulomonas rhizosphaerae]|uniref:Uncharacterized protein n=1 Tax=Cellulomonas rhizosphaerae TaxID=2293719 RepID=A0A413RJE4_9CELL|nr:hypothetical protein [Cellulomonas rhizosphaerae]RHA38700.1 hypothetical protein D1825_13275 [Cellulomonas rhizosphaerae]